MKSNKKYIFIAIFFTALLFLPILLREPISDFFDNWNDNIRAREFDIESRPEILAIEQNLDLTERGQRIFRASHPTLMRAEEFNQACPTHSREIFFLGCFDEATRTFAVFRVVSDELDGIIESTMAHEFLHAVWSRLTPGERSRLESLLMGVMFDNPSLIDDLAIYTEEQKAGELHSRVGTEIRDIPAELEAHYALYFNDRSRIVDFHAAFRAKFNDIRAAQADLELRMSDLQNEIDHLEQVYYSMLNDYNARLRNYEWMLSSGNTDFAGLEAIYNALVTMMNELNTLVDQINALVAQYNDLVEEYNSLGINLEGLYGEIKSREF